MRDRHVLRERQEEPPLRKLVKESERRELMLDLLRIPWIHGSYWPSEVQRFDLRRHLVTRVERATGSWFPLDMIGNVLRDRVYD